MMKIKKTKKILFNGHDFKFLNPVISHFENAPRYEVLIDEHSGHVITDTRKSAKLLQRADIIFCEWALGNAEWYSKNKKEHQILITRLHHQEIGLPYLERIDWNNVDKIIFICQNNMRLFLERYPFVSDKAKLIYNLINCDSFGKPKLYGAEFNLGFIGLSPKRKAPDIAFEILKRLKKIDKRYTLFFKGKYPWEYNWLWNRHEERRYYEELFLNLELSEYANSIVFDGHGKDMPEWFSKIGFILSTSDHEGSHQAVAEGMASGAIPVIRNWAGADSLYPERFVFSSVDEAVELITKWKSPEHYSKESVAVKEYARENFDISKVLPQYEKLLDGLLQSRSGGAQPSLSRHNERLPGPALAENIITAMHVCYINPGTQSGYVTRVVEETALLQKAGVRTIIACFVQKHFFSSLEKLSGHLEFLRGQTGALVHLISTDDYFDLSALAQGNRDIVAAIVDLAEYYNVDIIHGQTLASTLYGLHAGKHLKARVVFDVHGISPEEGELYGAHPARVKALTEWEKELLSNVDLSIFVSKCMKSHYESKYELLDPPHIVIPCCVHSERFRMTEDVRLMKRQELGINDKFVFLYLGTLSLWQWPEAMFSLFARVYQHRNDCLFYLLLPRSDHEQALQYLEKHNLSKESYIMKEVPHSEVGSVIGVADAGLLLREAHPVNYVSSPTKFGEYIAAGIPVLTTDKIGDISGIIKKEHLGLVLPLTDDNISAADLGNIFCFIDDIQKNRTQWSRRCADYAKTNFDWALCGTIIRDSYRKLMIDDNKGNFS